MIDSRLHAVGIAVGRFLRIGLPVKVEIVCHELSFAAVLVHDRSLPHKELRCQFPLKIFELRSEGPVDRPPHVRQIVPVCHSIAPVGEAEFPVHGLRGSEKILQIGLKKSLDMFSGCSVMLGLVVQLIADDAVIVPGHFTEFPDHPFRMHTVGRVHDVHDLASAVSLPSVFIREEDLRILLHQPGRHRVGRRADDDIHAHPITQFQRFNQNREIEFPVARLPCAPGRLRDPDHVDARVLHHLKVFLCPFIRHIFRIVRRSQQ